MQLSVSEAAERSGVSPRRIRELIASGRLPARRVGSSWIIEGSDMASFEPRAGRPMSAKNAWGFIDLIAGDRPAGLSPSEVSRLRKRRNELIHADPEDAARLLRSWLAERAERRHFRIAPADLPDLLEDSELFRSGLSDPRSGISAAGVAEGYVRSAHLASLVRRHLLVDSDPSRSNVVLHVSDFSPPSNEPAPLLLVAADLADYNSPRENNRVAEMVGQLA